MRYGFMFITVGMVLLLYEEEETRKVMLHYGGGWSVGCGVAILGLSLFSLSSLLFSNHVFIVLTSPRHVLHALPRLLL